MAKKFKDVDRGWKKFKRRWLKQSKLNKVAKVGVQAPEAQTGRGSGINMVTLGAIHEFGAPGAHIPSRSFIRSTFDENKKKYQTKLNKAGKNIALGKIPMEMGLMLVGEIYRGDIVKKMSRGQIRPKLSQATIKARAPASSPRKYKGRPSGDNVPLVDTGLLKDSMTTKIGKPL